MNLMRKVNEMNQGKRKEMNSNETFSFCFSNFNLVCTKDMADGFAQDWHLNRRRSDVVLSRSVWHIISALGTSFELVCLLWESPGMNFCLDSLRMYSLLLIFHHNSINFIRCKQLCFLCFLVSFLYCLEKTEQCKKQNSCCWAIRTRTTLLSKATLMSREQCPFEMRNIHHPNMPMFGSSEVFTIQLIHTSCDHC